MVPFWSEAMLESSPSAYAEERGLRLEAIFAHCRQRLATFKVPRFYAYVESCHKRSPTRSRSAISSPGSVIQRLTHGTPGWMVRNGSLCHAPPL
jgi:hypothetical protein